MPHPAGRMSFVELVRRKVEKMAWGPCLLCFHEADVALSHLMVSKKRLDTILAFSNSYGDYFRIFYFCQFYYSVIICLLLWIEVYILLGINILYLYRLIVTGRFLCLFFNDIFKLYLIFKFNTKKLIKMKIG